MAISPVTSGAPVAAPLSSEAVRAGGSSDGGFMQLFGKFINDANSQHLQSEETMRQFATGKTDNVHDVVLSVAKADLSFRMVLQIRNQLMESYQEIMRMQF
ncbi:MAG: flagellar hook-basal body complex protein FliE [Pirellulaceae bacterium]|nr:flagellar hook-basal body complex protein FliE [Planctomycetales bacterium]MCA9163004.1 flagellar hook-basal body complex protein FliE [Planctomycetales bacterium]MCA9205258.1 flagellar hook-basal body complex protein FliE [Planctomycetales bacterium]MCA9207260.1 flagellar hook-basal body complex protein FliE [Planctomycetales bacterium]MCA9225999.1 flagellar hook-basal body complex protein FliE [Planctomycetales bacterium]